MTEKMNCNVRLVVEASQGNGFDIYLDFSGKREYLITHRYNTKLYAILKNGMSLGELERSMHKIVSNISQYNQSGKDRGHRIIKTRRNQSRRFENSLEHVIDVVNDYMIERSIAA